MEWITEINLKASKINLTAPKNVLMYKLGEQTS